MAVRCFLLTASGLDEVQSAAQTLNALSEQLPRGAYTTFRTYHGDRVLHLDDHLDRLIESAAIEGQAITHDRRQARTALAEALARCGLPESRVRLTLTYDPPGAFYIALEPFAELPEHLYRAGVRCAVATPDLHRQLPRAKSTNFITPAARARRAAPDVEEVLLLDAHGALLEGSSSNFFAVLDGVLRTADEGVLAGTTRAMALALAADLLPCVLQPITIADLPRISEAFITSVSRPVLPVVEIEGVTIGAGVPGVYSVELHRRMREQIEQEAEPVMPA
jgi:branched-chain amino acid aminotransferase